MHCKNERFYQFEKNRGERESSFWLKKYFIVLSSVIRTKTQEEKNPEIIETVESNYKTSRPGSFY